MNTFIYKRIEMDFASRLELQGALPLIGWSKGMREGFSVGVCNDIQVRGRWIYTDRVEWEYMDEDTLERKTRTHERRMCAPFFIDFERSIMRVESQRDAKRVVEAMDRIKGIQVMCEPLDLDMNALYEAFTKKYSKTLLQELGLQDVIHEKILMTDANFKVIEAKEADSAVKRHKGRVKQLHFVVQEPYEHVAPLVYKVRISRNGKVAYDDDAPSKTLGVLEDMIMAFHRPEGSVNAENVDAEKKPAKKKGKK